MECLRRAPEMMAIVFLVVLFGSPAEGSQDGTDHKETSAEQSQSKTGPQQPEATPANVEKALLRYMKIAEDSYAPGYLGADGVFYKLKNAESLKAADLPVEKQGRQWRVIQGEHTTVEIERPDRLWFVSWKKDGTYRAACWIGDKAILLVFTGFRPIRVDEIPFAVGPISRVAPLEPDKLKCKIVEIKGPEDASKAEGDTGETSKQ